MAEVVGNYELLDRIGRGGMGEVWRARHRTLGRLVAVKLIGKGVLGGTPEQEEAVLRRFRREARTAASLRSVHTIQLLDFGVTERGAFYQVLELLDGIDLHDLVARHGPLPPARAVALLRQACDALAEAHALGFIHRDVKPSNLFLCRLGTAVDVVKVLDFGLARAVAPEEGAPGPGASLLTQAGTIPGSPAFLAPEVIRALAPATDRADIYGLGCVAWWLLTGRLVFDGASPIDHIVGHLERPVPRLADVPPALADLVEACLAKDPEARPTARELSRKLAALGLAWTEDDAEAWWAAHLPPSELRLPLPDVAPRPLPPELARAPLPELREHAYAVLRENFEHSRLDLREFERRVATARTADAPADVFEAIADLPAPAPLAPPPAVPSPVVPSPAAQLPAAQLPAAPTAQLPAVAADDAPRGERILAVFASPTRKGDWDVPRLLTVQATFGGATLDLREARLLPGCTEIRLTAVMGGIEVIVPPDLYFTVDSTAFAGGFDHERVRAPRPEGDTPWVRFRGAAVFGGVDIRVRPRPGERSASPDLLTAGTEALQVVAERISEAAERARERQARRRRDR